MEIKNLLKARTRDELRRWLEANTATETCCWVVVTMTEQPHAIQTSPYKMVGDEKDIRYFYYQLYQESYPTMEWPVDLLDEATYDTFLQSFLESGQVALSYPDYRSLKMTIAINTVPVATPSSNRGFRLYRCKKGLSLSR